MKEIFIVHIFYFLTFLCFLNQRVLNVIQSFFLMIQDHNFKKNEEVECYAYFEVFNFFLSGQILFLLVVLLFVLHGL